MARKLHVLPGKKKREKSEPPGLQRLSSLYRYTWLESGPLLEARPWDQPGFDVGARLLDQRMIAAGEEIMKSSSEPPKHFALFYAALSMKFLGVALPHGSGHRACPSSFPR